MTEMGTYNDNFSAFIHHPNAEQFMLPEEKAAVMSFQMKGKFIDGYNINEDLYTKLLEYFNAESGLEDTGLEVVFWRLHEAIKTEKNIGLILYGYYHLKNSIDVREKLLCQYINPKMKIVDITVESVCANLMKKYFTDSKEVIRLCKETPNYEIYLGSV